MIKEDPMAVKHVLKLSEEEREELSRSRRAFVAGG